MAMKKRRLLLNVENSNFFPVELLVEVRLCLAQYLKHHSEPAAPAASETKMTEEEAKRKIKNMLDEFYGIKDKKCKSGFTMEWMFIRSRNGLI